MKTIQLIKGLESIAINRNHAIIKELQYTHIGMIFQYGYKFDISRLLGKPLPMTKKYCADLWNFAQWAEQTALIQIVLPNVRPQYINRYIVGVQYSINLVYNYMILRDMNNDSYVYISLDSDTTYNLYSYHYKKQLQSLDEALINLVDEYKPSLKDKLLTWLKNAIN